MKLELGPRRRRPRGPDRHRQGHDGRPVTGGQTATGRDTDRSLNIRNLRKEYRAGEPVLKDVSLERAIPAIVVGGGLGMALDAVSLVIFAVVIATGIVTARIGNRII